MELLEKAQSAYDELRTIADAMSFLEKKLSRKDINEIERENTRRDEFKLAMEMSDVKDDLDKYLKELEKAEGMSFLVKKIRDASNKIMKVRVIDVTRNV